MSARAKLEKSFIGGLWLRIDEDDYDGKIAEVLLVNKAGRLLEKDFLISLGECIDQAFEFAGEESPETQLLRQLDEERMVAVKDVCYLVNALVTVSPIDLKESRAKFEEIFKRWNKLNGTMWNKNKQETENEKKV